MSGSAAIPLDEETVEVLLQCGPILTHVLQRKFGCGILFHGMDAAASGGSKRPFRAEKRLTFCLAKGLTVAVWKDDLASHEADAVVNAANADLQHGAGLAQALCDAGGPNIQRMSNEILKANKGSLRTGDAVVTQAAGRLKCKAIIHAVGPSLPYQHSSHDVQQATPLLERAVWNILRRVEENRWQSVAIPALSSGLFNFPLPKCAETLVKTLRHYHDTQYQGQPLEIRLVNWDEPSVREMELACHRILGSTGSSSHGGTQRGQGSASPSTSKVQIGDVILRIKQGRIEEEMVDVIVNTIAVNLKLSVGEISKAILQTAGPKIQGELSHNGYASNGDVIETKGYHLKSKQVYHTICAPRNEPFALQILNQAISTCLKKAAKSQVSSISFPAIGTGSLGFQKQEVAQIMSMAVVEFAKSYLGKMMEINFVIFPNDMITWKAFEKEMASIANSGNPRKSSVNEGKDHKGFRTHGDRNESKADIPCITLQAASSEIQREAVRWVHDRLILPCRTLTITNNHILHLGQDEHRELASVQKECAVSILEFLKNGQAGVCITGPSKGVRAAGLRVESLCCKAMEELALAEERAMMNALQTTQISTCQRKLLNHQSSDYKERETRFKSSSLRVIQVERMENQTLKELFDLKKKQLSATPKRMYQRVQAQYCNLIGRMGFQREYAPPNEQRYGAGIYFTSSVHEANKLWSSMPEEEYIYFIEAQVLAGRSTHGSPGLIVPPPLGADPLTLYDSVHGSIDTCVVFNAHQAFPEYFITCIKS